ncbi:MAG TPA: glycosyltransferase family 2 protein [Actinomycetota bacterium]|nr:glycosyltransferase family 2 protein [Actinomycetota bacterium]
MTSVDVSVLTPSFGYARFIGDALRSVSLQAGVEVAHVVQDAGSEDGTVELLREAGPGVDWRSEPDSGQSDALNRAFARAQGTWVSWLNADEFYLPGALRHLVDEAERHNADIVYGDSVFVDRDGRLERLLSQHRFDRTTLFHYGTIIPSCAVLMRREAFRDSRWDGSLRLLMDRDIYLQLVQQGAKAVYTKRPIGAFRVHDERVSAGTSASFATDYARIAEKYGPTSKAMKRLATARHRALKLLDGSYGKQRRVATLKGRNLRWFDSQEGTENCVELMRVYGVGTRIATAAS